MTNTLLDFSLRSELALHTRVVADVEAAAAPVGIAPLIVGAFARDLHLLYRCGVKMQRQTEDLEFAMDVFGFREALATAHPVPLPGQVHTRLVSLPALTVLKIMCWQDRHYQSPRKDAHDLQMILRHYLAADNESRLYGDFVDWTQSDDFDYELAGPRMLGYDIRQLLDAASQAKL